jgi:hypothetical protein
MSLYGYDRPTTPRLERFATRQSVVFENAISQSSWTLPAHVSLLSGLNPNRHESNLAQPAAPSLRLMAEILREAKYSTMAVTGGAFLNPQYGLSQGFDRYFFDATPPHLDTEGGELQRGVKQAIKWMREYRERPFFMFLHTYEVHDPYRPRQPYFSRFTDLPPITVDIPPRTASADNGFVVTRSFADLLQQPELEHLSLLEAKELVSAAYDSGVAFADEQIGLVLDELIELNLRNRTIVVITSDHGELLGEKGRMGHLYLDHENIRVPLLIAVPPGLHRVPRVPEQVRSIDVLPTILDLVGREAEPDIDGSSLVPLMKGEVSAFPKDAFSYAARWNAGIALRLRDGRIYHFNDAPWIDRAEAEKLFGLQRPTISSTSLPSPEDPAMLRARVESEFFDEIPGLKLRLDNRNAATFTGIIDGWINPYNVKTIDMKCNCLEFRDRAAHFSIPPSESFTLVLMVQRENLSKLRLQLSGQIDLNSPEPSQYEGIVKLDKLAEGYSLMLTDSGFTESGSREADSPAASARIWRDIPINGYDAKAAAIGSALKRQLEALGYSAEIPTQ